MNSRIGGLGSFPFFFSSDIFTFLIYCAYYESLAELNLGDIRAFLADYLPDYMIPARFIRLRQLPRNRSGKINYAELMNRPYQGKTAGGHKRS